MLHHVNMTETITSTTELSPLLDVVLPVTLPVEIWIPSWMGMIPNTELDPIDLIHTPVKCGAIGAMTAYALLHTMLEQISTGADLKTCINAADDLNELYHSYDIEIDKDHGRWIMMIDCHPTRAEIVVDLSGLVNW